MTKSIEQIASTHLGKAGDGTIVKPYVTPTTIDKTLLVPVPRILNRTQYNIDENALPFVGYDVWNSYEFSTLTDNGYPVVGHLKLVYSSDSEFIVESKSLKLYLNSFNMVHLGKNSFDAILKAEQIIKTDLRKILGNTVDVTIFDSMECSTVSNSKNINPISPLFVPLETLCNVNDITFDRYTEAPDLLTGTANDRKVSIKVHTPVLRSNCRVTNQPDWGDVFIYMLSNHKISYNGLMKYLVSMRSENHFHEEICECIYKRLYDKFSPDELFVSCLYTRRGGIDINPVRASSDSIIDIISPRLVSPSTYVQKLWRQ